MHFDADKVETFATYFKSVQHRIRNQDGCLHLEMWQGTDHPDIVFTFSIWRSEEALEKYRQSEDFKEFWGKAKENFIGKPQAWTIKVLTEA